jgi:hypothetical protein
MMIIGCESRLSWQQIVWLFGLPSHRLVQFLQRRFPSESSPRESQCTVARGFNLQRKFPL